MKISNTEKLVIVFIIVMFVGLVNVLYTTNKMIENKGGMRNIIVDVGKEVKQIGKDINEE